MVFVVLAALPQFQYPWGSHALDQAWETVCLALAFLGFAIRAITIGTAPNGTSGRNTQRQVAGSLNTTGMYSIVRNPLYLGNFFMIFGVVAIVRIWWVTAIYMLLFVLHYERIILAEEAYLAKKFGASYTAWAHRTPAVVPRLHGWISPERKFSWKRVLRREYHGVCGLVLAMFCIELLCEGIAGGGIHIDRMWGVLMALTAVVYVTIRVIHKRTRLLHGD